MSYELIQINALRRAAGVFILLLYYTGYQTESAWGRLGDVGQTWWGIPAV